MTSPAIKLARECFVGDAPLIAFCERFYALAQAKALRDAASKFRGEIGYNFVAADGYSNGFDVASELDFMSEELEKQA